MNIYKLIMIRFSLLLIMMFSGNMIFCQDISTEILISESGRRPVIQIDSLENIHIIWWDFGIYHSIYDTSGVQILSPHGISSFGSQYTDLALGNAIGISVWEGGAHPGEPKILGQLFAINGDTIGGNFRIDYPPTYDSYRYDANIIHTHNDSFFVVWTWQVGSIHGQFIGDSSITYNNILISDHPIVDITFPLPKVSGSENCPYIVVVWIDDRVSTPLLYGRTFSTTGVPQDSSFLISEVPNIIEVANSSIIMNDCGEFTVAYIAALDDSIRNVYYRSFDPNGQPLTASQMISQSPVGDLIDMAINTNGQYIIEWEATVGDRSSIAAQRFQSDGSLIGNNFWVSNTSDTVNQCAPSVFLHNSNVYSAWYEQDDTLRPVWLNIIDFNNPPIGIKEEYIIPSKYSLNQNYPNPFNPTTTIQYELPQRSDVQITVYDLLGRQVTNLVSETQEAGNKSIQWDATNVSSGMYFYQIRAGEFVETKKMVVLK